VVNMIKAKILILEPAKSPASFLQNRLTRLGHNVIGRVSAWEEFSVTSQTILPDLVVINLPLNKDENVIEAACHFQSGYNCAVLYVISEDETEFLRHTNRTNKPDHLIKPFQEAELGSAIDLVLHKRTLKALQESEERYDHLFDNLPIGIYRTTPEGKILYANSALVKMLGHETFADMASQNLSATDFEPSYSRQDFCERLARENQILGLESVWKKRDGSSMSARENVKVVRGSDDSILYYEGTVEDITESKETQERLRILHSQFKKVFDVAPYPMLISTLAEGRIIDINEHYLQQFGFERSEVIGHTAQELNVWVDYRERQKMAEIIRQKGCVRDMEINYRRKDGEVRIGVLSAEVMEFDNQQCIIGTINDISERKQAENTLRDLTNRFQKVFSVAPHAMLITRLDDECYVDVNETFLRKVGYSKEEIIGKTSKEFDLWVDAQERAKLYNLLKKTGSVRNFEMFYRRKSGEIRVGLSSAEIVEFDNQKFVIAALNDITARKESENVLRASIERYKLLAENSTDVISRHTPKGEYLYVSPATRSLLGYEPDEMIGQVVSDFLHPEDAMDLREKQIAILRSQNIYTQAYRYRCSDGNYKWMESTIKNIRDPKTQRTLEIISVSRDITERKHAEEALRTSEERFRNLALNSPDFIYVIDLAQQKAVYSNCEEMFGYDQAALNDYSFLKALVYFEDKQIAHEHWLRLLNGETGSVELRLRKKSGTWEWLNCRYNALSFDTKGNPMQSLLTTSVITERKLAEELLQKYADDLNDLYQNAPCGYHSIDRDGTFVRINDTELQWLGYSRGELIGNLKISDLVTQKERERFNRQFSLLKTRGWIKDFETEITCKDGSLLPILLNAAAIKDQNGNFIIGHITIYDRTERKLADDKLKKSHQQMQALSAHLLSVREEERTRIAREIHDEFGQALTILKFDLSALGKKLSEDQHDLLEKIWAMSTMIDNTANSVRRICADLRPAILDFGLTAAMEWLAAEFQKLTGIQCNIDVKAAGFALDMSLSEELSTSIFRICQEALTNVARHAEATSVSIALEKLHNKLSLNISDNGKGIESVEPSTTLSFGVLGIKERARLLGGEISIKGTPQTGTQIKLLVPLTQQEELQYV
jgi:PAS domain S-box-containing protein